MSVLQGTTPFISEDLVCDLAARSWLSPRNVFGNSPLTLHSIGIARRFNRAYFSVNQVIKVALKILLVP